MLCIMLTVSICLPNFANIITSSDFMLHSLAEDDSPSAEVLTGTFKITGSVEFNEKLNGTDWKSLVRPPEFGQPIKIIQKYTVDGQEYTNKYYAQNDVSSEAFYLKFVHDGNGAGDFTIENVPKSVKIGENTYNVTGYEVSVEPDLPYYNSTSINVNKIEQGTTVATGTIQLSLKSQNITLNPTVLPAENAGSASFNMNIRFTNNHVNPNKSIDRTYNVNINTSTVSVPVGIEYSLTQSQTSGFKFDGKYTTIIDGNETIGTTARGIITENQDIEIKTVNYAQNLSCKFGVEWIDNNSISRPYLTADNFELRYKIGEDGEMKALTLESLAELGIDEMPAFVKSNINENEYFYKGLPALSASGKNVSYEVVIKKNPEGYTSSKKNNSSDTVFVFAEKTDFNAYIYWNDDGDRETKRPENINNLNLYRIIETGVYERVPLPDDNIDKFINKQGKMWEVKIPDLPRYDSSYEYYNHEYDYVLVQGTIENDEIIHTSIDNYKTYYDNGSESYGNDISLCHNGGKITEVLYSETDFSAQKVWKDNPEEDVRPESTVTLWRYVEADGIDDLDEAYNEGKVSQVIFQTTGENGKLIDNIMSYELDNTSNPKEIIFNLQTVEGLSQSYKLPGNDDHGRKYVYFVRETLSGTNEDNYEIKYVDSDGTVHKNGALNGGQIINVRREKALVSVEKIWKSPSGYENIDDSSVEMKISAPDINGEYKELTVYSDTEGSYEVLTGDNKSQAQTASGFTETIPSAEVSYYVNIYDENGMPYDMTKACFVETVTDKDGNVYSLDLDSGILKMGDTTYTAESKYKDMITLGDGKKNFRYNLTNTITAKRDYKLIKEWQLDGNSFADVQFVNFKLYRRSTKDMNGQYEEVGIYQVERQDGNKWTKIIENLDKFDENGYEYYYLANEVSITKTDETKISIGESGWSVIHHYTPDQTTAVNHTGGNALGYLTVSKLWQDNGDTDAHKPITIRIYDKNQFLVDIQNQMTSLNKNGDDIADIKSITNYYQHTLTEKSNNYTREIYFNTINSAIGSSGKSCDDYIILEYMVGGSADGAEPAEYTYNSLMGFLNESSNIEGTVENTDRQYDVSISTDSRYGHTFIINTRSGKTSISVNKQWNDDNNAIQERPENVKFQIYQDGEKYTDIPETVSLSNESATLDRNNGILTLSGGDYKQWITEIQNLPMFSNSGILHFYNIEEIPSENNPNTSVAYISKKAISDQTTTGKEQSYNFNYENTITGTVSHIAYKYWKDVSVSPDSRPDIYFKLFRYLKNDESKNLTEYLDYKGQVWTKESENTGVDYATGYNWKITIDDLPEFDENGNQYVYLFTETINNNGVTVFGTYTQQSETRATENNEDTYEVFTNTINDYMTVKGLKTWTGLTGYSLKKEDLPDPEFHLYRTTDSTITDIQNISDELFNSYRAENKITLVDETVLENKTKYSFPRANAQVNPGFIERVNGVLMLPKFDSEGRRYNYLVRETFTGNNIVDQLYIKNNQNGTISNVFKNDLNRRSITITKNWAGRESIIADNEKQYPSVTYTLYRYELNNEENTKVQIESHKINSQDFAGGSAAYTFQNLLIYSPNGTQYCYYIEEKHIDGYSTQYNDGGIAPDNRIDITDVPDTWNTDSKNNCDVSTLNTYDQKGNIKLSGEKIWNDYANYEGLRPPEIIVTLKRHTASESGQNNAVNQTVVNLIEKNAVDPNETKPYIVWNKGENPLTSEKWSYTIYNLERYAPNGMPYVYTLSEEQLTGYKKANDVSSLANSDTETKMSDMTNSFSGSYYVRKNWMDGYNKYNLRPTSITVKLQRSTDNVNWNDVIYSESMKDKLPHVLKNSENKDIVSVTLDINNVIQNTKSSSWQYTFNNLPTISENGKTYKYRCVEVKIGNVDIEQNKNNGKYTAGAYECRYTTQNAEKTVIENTLDSTSLVVTKQWEDDQNDLYKSRPDSLEFVLQKRGYIITENGENPVPTEWTDVTVLGNRTFTISKNDNWTKTLDDLPVIEVIENENGTTSTVYSLYFRAVEVHRDENGEIVKGAENYKDVTTDYSLENNYNAETHRNEFTIKNKLILDEPAKSITVTKKWQRTKGENVTAVFELLYKTKDETRWHCYGDNSVVDVNNLKSHSPNSNCLTQKSSCTNMITETLTKWTNLPKYDRNGKELEYKVIEHPVQGYETVVKSNGTEGNYATEYTFINTEYQNYTVKKVWQNTDYAHKDSNGKFSATFVLQRKIGNGEWETVPDSEITLTSSTANDDSQQHTWENLPKYNSDYGTDNYGKAITYRAVETKINGNDISTDDNYIVTYQYDDNKNPEFRGTKTVSTNRMVYGFVNLSKTAVYLTSTVQESNGKKLKDVVFDIYDSNGNLYASNIITDSNGNLIRNSDGTYGTENKYLISGTYTLREKSTNTDFSIWKNGVSFTVGNSGTDDTGEHGTAWIYTEININNGFTLNLNVQYFPSNEIIHTFADECIPKLHNTNAYNVESRGVIEFEKTGENGTDLDTHGNATRESSAYFGVYLDENCKNQVAGMTASDKVHFVLTNKKENGTKISENKNNSDIPYLREYKSGFSLLSGTYYIKEIVAPAGYKLDTTVRKAVISHIAETEDKTDISDIYSNNKAEIMLVSQTSGTAEDKWNNVPNKVKIYKKDQYGRNVTLKTGGYLELKIDSGTFPSGEDTIRLYQSIQNPATKTDGITSVNNITYDGTAWTITGLLDINKTYTLSEPDISVPENNVKAVDISFTIDNKGKITANAESKDNPLAVNGEDYGNYYKSDSDENIIVMRDVSRYLKDVALKKTDSKTNAVIPNISFKLCKYEIVNDVVKEQSVLADNIYLTTNTNGEIVLSEQSGTINNSITGCKLKFGLDIGKYYFEEIEKGASDKYRLSDKIYFEIKTNPDFDFTTSNNYNDCAIVVFDKTNANISQDTSKMGTVKNIPVTEIPKTLALSKVNKDNSTEKLQGAEFTLEYTSITNKQTGSANKITYNCITNENGELYLKGENKKPDISNKGSYILKETKAPDNYMTRTENNTVNVVTMLTFDVNSDNEIVNINCYNGTGNLVSANVIKENNEDTRLDVTIKNEKTVVSIAKRNDIENSIKTKNQKSLDGEPLNDATLEIFEGTDTNGTPVQTLSGNSNWTLTGELKENTVYTLHEETAPVGYLKADDIYFKLFGTTTKNSEIISQLYVWNGINKPTSVDGNNWKKITNLKDNVLTMVDEAIIAPVDMKKVVGDSTYEILENAEFEVSVGNEKIGIAVSSSTGYLVWKEIYKYGLIYDKDGKRITSEDSVIGQTIILRQNSDGYTFTETYAPDNAYNDGQSYTVKITAENYTKYKTANGYNSNLYIDIFMANQSSDKTVSNLSSRSTSNSVLVNPQYKSTVTLHKYDSDEEANRKAIPDTEFTLYRISNNSESVYKKAQSGGTVNSTGVFRTDENGNISITIPEKGTYILRETKSAVGYEPNSQQITFYLQDEATDEERANNKFGYGQTNVLKIDESGVPNSRLKGSVTLTKRDENTNELLNGVVYTLKRTDTPSQPDNFLLKNPVDVTTGKNYTALKTETGWELQESQGTDGKIIISGLNWGSYTLIEKTPLSGYKLDTADTYSFTVKSNELVFETEKTNTKNSITFYKTNTIDNDARVNKIKGLAGAVFEVHEGDSCSGICQKVSFYNSESATATETVQSVISGDNGKVTIYGLPTDNTSDTPKKYHLAETTAPKGYKLQTNPVVFTVDRYGNIQVNGGNAEEVTMTDEPIKIYIEKYNADYSNKLNGAEFRLTDVCENPEFNHKLANDSLSETIRVETDGRVMIPVERVIAGHTYQLEETKAPDGYECTAVVTFKVKTDGTIELNQTDCAKLDTNKTTIEVKDEIIGVTLKKVDYSDDTKLLAGVKFTLEPYGNSSFATYDNTNLEYDITTNTYTFTTNQNGEITIPDGLLKHDNKYLLKEIETIDGYYLGNEAKDGVILNVGKDGNITIERLVNYENNTIDGKNSCPVSSNGSILISKNMKSTSFELTKKVEGNMGDLSGIYQIKMEVFEPDGTFIANKTVSLKLNDKYDSSSGENAFGTIPVGATLKITEDNELDYSAIVRIKNQDNTIKEIKPDENNKGTVSVKLDSETKISIELVNTKNVTIDIGVGLERESALALTAIIIPAVWIYMRSRRKRVFQSGK